MLHIPLLSWSHESAGREIEMNDLGDKLTGVCAESCPHPPDELKLSIEISQVATELGSLTHCRYKLADQAFRRFRIIHGLRLIWQAHRSHRLTLRLFRESQCLMGKAEKAMMKELKILMKETEARMAQHTSVCDVANISAPEK